MFSVMHIKPRTKLKSDDTMKWKHKKFLNLKHFNCLTKKWAEENEKNEMDTWNVT